MEQQLHELEDRPWEQPGVLRRDCVPHRGGLLLGFGRLSGCIGLLSLVFVLPSPFGLFMSAAVWVLAYRDLAEMRAGQRDSAGEADTGHALGCAMAGIVLNGIALATGLMYLLGFLVS